MINHRFVVFAFLICCFCTKSGAQEKKLSDLVSHIDKFTEMYQQEKVYLHFDNTCYFIGDTIWFKAHLVGSVWHVPNDWSRTLYVELVTPEGDVVETKKYKVTDGQCHGDLGLSERLRSGYYEVRAYTRWMQNFGDGNVFSRVFPVFDKPEKPGDYRRKMKDYGRAGLPDHRVDNFWKYWKSPDKQKIEVGFYPEGGNLVKGLGSRVAFKATGTKGEDIDVAGRVLDKNKNVVAMFNTLHDGMGVFEFVPETGSYTAEIDVDGKTHTFPLPKVSEEGCVVKADPFSPDQIRIELQRSRSMQSEWLGVTVVCRGKVFGSTIIEPSEQQNILLSFPRQGMPSGVSQVTVFNARGDVLAERMVFTNHHSELKIGVTQSKPEYRPFEYIGLAIDIQDSKGQPVKTNFSLAVRDAGKSCRQAYTDNILTNFLLSSDLKGYIKNPGWYFADESRSRVYALDLLLMVHGWSRYVWKQMAGTAVFEARHPAEESVSIDGRVLTYGNKPQPSKDTKVLMWMISDGSSLRADTVTDEEGRFVFAFDVWDDWDLSIQVSENNKNVRRDIRLNRTFDPPLRKLSYYEKQTPGKGTAENISVQEERANDVAYNPDLDLPDSLKAQQWDKSSIMLDEALVKERRKWEREAKGLEYASVVYDVEPMLDKQKDRGEDDAIDVFDFLRGNNPYWSPRFPGSHKSDKYDKYKGRPIIYTINNGAESDVRSLRLNELNIEQIKLITIDETHNVNPEFVLIHVYTYENHRPARQPKGIRQTKLRGYSPVREFYSPSYNRPVIPGETDYRRTLYWNPNVQTDSLGHADVSFYNNSTGKKIEVSAEIITLKGVIGTTDLR